ncbi:proline-%2C glutamic acid- and leucine-rich protein 1-like [Scomber scombrus]|uniref:Proline-, glutamic acid- and leucine-rich protein 1-like n=1 Tax=Scomber scombrus TaxID=13677 RepID=A0AAV1PIQ8_SCOSC
MAFVGPPFPGQHRLIGDAHQMDDGRPGAPVQLFIIERPAGDGLPELIRILEDEDHVVLPDYVSSDEEDWDVQVGIGVGAPLFFDNEEDIEVDSEEEEDEDGDDSEDWTSEDSGYESLLDDEEDEDFRPRSPLVQQLPPVDFWQGWREDYPPLHAGPPVAGPPVAGPPVAGPPVAGPLEPEEFAPPTPGLGSSMKRSREEDLYLEEERAKRPRWNCEENPEDPVPSASGPSTSSDLDSAPSTSSGLHFAFRRRLWDGPFSFSWRCEDSDSD